MPVMNKRAIKKTMADVPAIVCQLNDRGPAGRPCWFGPAGCIGPVVASNCSAAAAPAAAEASWRSVSSPDAVDGDGDWDNDGDGDGARTSSDEPASPVATVEPSLRSRGDESGA